MIPNWLKRGIEVIVEGIRTRSNNATLNALLGIPDDVNGSLGDRLGFGAGSPFTATENLKDILGDLSTPKNLGGILGAFTTVENLKAIFGDLSTTKRLGQILGAFDETDTLKATLGAFTATENLKAIFGNLSTTKRLGQILGTFDETDTLKAILGAFTATENLKAILGDITTTKNLGGILGGFTTTNNLKALLGLFTPTDNLKDVIGGYTAALPVKTALDNLKGPTGIFHEQADVAVSISVDNVGVDILDLNVADTRYIIRDMRLKLAADPGANTLTISLETLINNTPIVVDTFDIDTTNWGTYFSLMDMFGVPHIAGDDIHIYATYSVAGPITLTGQYSHAKTNV